MQVTQLLKNRDLRTSKINILKIYLLLKNAEMCQLGAKNSRRLGSLQFSVSNNLYCSQF